MTVYVLDHFYLLITLLITVAYQLSGFFVAWVLQFDKITGTAEVRTVSKM